MATQSRFVDSLSASEKDGSVEVLVIGLSRTGTMCTLVLPLFEAMLLNLAMYYALQKLGYKSYHMLEACNMTRKGHLTMWNEAVSAKYSHDESNPSTQPAAYTSSDFHKLLQDYNALSDIPSIHFVPELMSAYPHARLILTKHPRGIDGWLRSMNNSFFRIGKWSVWSWPLMKYDIVFTRPYMTLFRRSLEIWTKKPWPIASDFAAVEPRLRALYSEHNNEMRKFAREQGRELLEFDPTNGWAPLCEFLGREPPAEPFPHANEGNSVANLHFWIVVLRLKATFTKRAITVGGGIFALCLAWYWVANRGNF